MHKENPRIAPLWLAVTVGPALLALSVAAVASGQGTERPLAYLVLATVGSIGGMVFAIILATHSRRIEAVELAYLALFVLSVSSFRLIHALLTPGVFYESNESFSASAFWALPISLLLALPARMGAHDFRERIDANLNRWMKWSFAAVIALGLLLFVDDDVLPGPVNDQWWVGLFIAGSILGSAWFAGRHLYLAFVAASRRPLVVALGYGLMAASSVVWLNPMPYSLTFWVGQLMGILGALVATGGALFAYRRESHRFLDPIVSIDQRSSLELQNDPLLGTFLSFMNEKDPINKQHVSGTIELVVTIGSRLELSKDKLRDVALSALLHDIGMTVVPESLLNKPSPLTDKEMAIVQRHVNYGADMLEESPVLRSIAPIVRAHHEHIDGSGYPLGLHGSQIPPLARLLSVCDGYDAMINSREYRRSVGVEEALFKMEQLAGFRWDRRVVETLVRWARTHPPEEMPQYLDSIGRIGCDCLPSSDRAFDELAA